MEFYFLEINPRLQVEHTVTESICSTDIVRAQLLIAQGASLEESGLTAIHGNPKVPPPLCSLQLRITAEDPSRNWSLSVGRIQSSHFPSSNGIRCDTNVVSGIPMSITADFDSLISKLIVTAPSWPATLEKARRALGDIRIIGVQTNLPVLKAILRHQDFVAGRCTTRWLESQQTSLLASASRSPGPKRFGQDLFAAADTTPALPAAPSSSQVMFRKDDAWTLSLSPLSPASSSDPSSYHVHLTRLLKNDFPASLAAELAVTPTSAAGGGTVPFRLSLDQTSTSSAAAASASTRPRFDPKDPTHVPIPFAGKVVELLIEEGDEVREGETLLIVRQMKMELEVRSPRGGRVEYVVDVEEGGDVGEGWLGAVIVDLTREGRPKL